MAFALPDGRKWLRRGVNVLLATTGVIGGLYLFAQFTLSKFNEFQERLLRDRVAREKCVPHSVRSRATDMQSAAQVPAEPGGLQLYRDGAPPDALCADL